MSELYTFYNPAIRVRHSQYHHVFELVPGQPNHGSVCLLDHCLANLLHIIEKLVVRDDNVPACCRTALLQSN